MAIDWHIDVYGSNGRMVYTSAYVRHGKFTQGEIKLVRDIDHAVAVALAEQKEGEFRHLIYAPNLTTYAAASKLKEQVPSLIIGVDWLALFGAGKFKIPPTKSTRGSR